MLAAIKRGCCAHSTQAPSFKTSEQCKACVQAQMKLICDRDHSLNPWIQPAFVYNLRIYFVATILPSEQHNSHTHTHTHTRTHSLLYKQPTCVAWCPVQLAVFWRHCSGWKL